MTANSTPPSVPAALADLDRRVRELERNRTKAAGLLGDLADANVYNVKPGQSIVWDGGVDGTGYWIPGGGGARSYFTAARTTVQSIPNNSSEIVAYDSTYYQTGAVDISRSGGTMVFSAAGVYVITVQCSWAPGSTGYRELQLFTSLDVGAAPAVTQLPITGANYTSQVVTSTVEVLPAAVGTGANVLVKHTNGAALNIVEDATRPNRIQVVGFAL